MQKIAKFEKVSFDRFQKDWLKAFPETEDVQAVYDSIVLPQRATAGSAGYDFYVPAAVTFPKDASVLVPTGIRARMAEGWVLAIFPRSGLGFKHGSRRRRLCPGHFSSLWDHRGRRCRRRAGRRIWFHHKEINYAQMAVCPRTRPVFLQKERA